MFSEAVSPWQGKGHEPEISDLQVGPRTGRILIVFISTGILQKISTQGALTSLGAPLPGQEVMFPMMLPISSQFCWCHRRTKTERSVLLPPHHRWDQTSGVVQSSSLKTHRSGTKHPSSSPSWPWEQLLSGSITETFGRSASLTHCYQWICGANSKLKEGFYFPHFFCKLMYSTIKGEITPRLSHNWNHPHPSNWALRRSSLLTPHSLCISSGTKGQEDT